MQSCEYFSLFLFTQKLPFPLTTAIKAALVALVVVVGFSSSIARAQNLVANPGFEAGYAGYTQSGNLSFTFVTNDSHYVHSGTFGAAVGPIGSDGFLTQNLNTVAGRTYDIAFFLNSSGLGRNDFNVSFGGNTVFSQTNVPETHGFQEFNAIGVATGTSTVLTVGFRNDPGYFGLDDISVTSAAAPVPEVSTKVSFSLLLALGMGGLVSAARKKQTRAGAGGTTL